MGAGWGDPPPGMSGEVDRAAITGAHRPQDRTDMAVARLARGRAKAIRQATPEWVMLGLQWPGPGVLLMASRSLTQAELDFRARSYKFESWDAFLAPGGFRPELTLQVHMRNDYIVVAGPDYLACLEALLRQWSPDDRAQAALPAIEAAAAKKGNSRG